MKRSKKKKPKRWISYFLLLLFIHWKSEEWTVGKVFHFVHNRMNVACSRCWVVVSRGPNNTAKMRECKKTFNSLSSLNFTDFFSFFLTLFSSSSRHQRDSRIIYEERRQKTTTNFSISHSFPKLTSKHGNLSFYCDVE